MRFTWYHLLVAMVLAWILCYRKAVRLMDDYGDLVDNLVELFIRYDYIVSGVELNNSKVLVTSRFQIHYDPYQLERFFFSLECAIFETNKTYDKLTSYICYLSNKKWQRIKAMQAITQDLEDRIRTYRLKNVFASIPQKWLKLVAMLPAFLYTFI